MDWASKIPTLLACAWLLPLASFVIILVGGRKLGRAGRGAAWIACGAIVGSFCLSTIALAGWLWINPLAPPADHAHHGPAHASVSSAPEHSRERPAESSLHKSPGSPTAQPLCGIWYTLGEFGSSRVAISYYIDGLTVAMFVMVSLIASCIHVYSIGYMHEELDEVTDEAVRLADGRRLRRPGRFHRFFQHLSLFSFSMLGLIVAGNLAMVFCFWELVGICSYLLIGFYIERSAASNAANKAFIVNRVGDFGMIVGLMVFWAGLGTLSFGDIRNGAGEVVEQGVFSLVRPEKADHDLVIPEGLVRWSARGEISQFARAQAAAGVPAAALPAERIEQWRSSGWGYGLLVLGGLGLFCGCIGKSAQFPLHVWLPDAMEGPTPVSALVHSATMVAAGVYLTARCFPIFVPEVLLTIAVVGCITLLLAATIALTATDIKRVLAYSTVSQLGYMMLALGSGGWVAGVLHLFTHAFFKSLLFLCSGSVIHACRTNELTQMGGLARKMPWTAVTMLVGCLAIIGAGIPLVGGLSGYYSKDAILAQQYVFAAANPHLGWMFYAAAIGAAMTAFYMFRLWFLAFVGKPRDAHVFDHVHESPPVMTGPLVLLAVLAVAVAWHVPLTHWGLEPLLSQARPLGIDQPEFRGLMLASTTIPGEHLSHDASVHTSAALLAFAMGAAGVLLAAVMYAARKLDPADVAGQFPRAYRFLLNKWWFDELYHFLWVRPTMALSRWTAQLDQRVIDYVWDSAARGVTMIARLDDWVDRRMVDRALDRIADAVYRLAIRARGLQSGYVRHYVLAIAVGLVALVVVMSLYWSNASAGW